MNLFIKNIRLNHLSYIHVGFRAIILDVRDVPPKACGMW